MMLCIVWVGGTAMFVFWLLMVWRALVRRLGRAAIRTNGLSLCTWQTHFRFCLCSNLRPVWTAWLRPVSARSEFAALCMAISERHATAADGSDANEDSSGESVHPVCRFDACVDCAREVDGFVYVNVWY